MRFIEKIKALKAGVMGMNCRNIEMIYPNNQRKDYKYADDKSLTKSRLDAFGISCPQTYAQVRGMGMIEEVWDQVNHHESLVIKPANGAGGNGIFILKKEKVLQGFG